MGPGNPDKLHARTELSGFRNSNCGPLDWVWEQAVDDDRWWGALDG
jgi:hypothetical protein